MLHQPLRVCVLLLIALLFVQHDLSAQDSKVSAPMPPDAGALQTARSLLEGRWEKNKDNRENSVDDFLKHAGDSRVLLSYTLNRMQHRKYRDALNAAKALTSREPDNVDGWVLRIWLETLRDNYDNALLSMNSLKAHLDKLPKLSVNKKREIYRRLGRLVGYMQGPVGDKVNADVLDNALATVTRGLPKDQLDMFDQGLKATLKKYEDLTKTHSQKIADETQKVETQNKVQSENIVVQNAEMKQRIKELEPRIDSLHSEGYAALERVQAEARPLEQQLAYLDRQIGSQIFALDLLYNDLYLYRQSSINHPNLYFINLQIQDRQLAINSLRRQFRSVNQQLANVNARAVQVRNSYNRRIEEVESELKRIGYVRKKNDRKLLKLAKGPRVASGKVGSLSSRAKALKTYDPFPLESVRQEVLQQLR